MVMPEIEEEENLGLSINSLMLGNNHQCSGFPKIFSRVLKSDAEHWSSGTRTNSRCSKASFSVDLSMIFQRKKRRRGHCKMKRKNRMRRRERKSKSRRRRRRKGHF